jgi:hypothetical protein
MPYRFWGLLDSCLAAAAVALANKNTQIIWALLTQKTDYEEKADELSSGEPICG